MKKQGFTLVEIMVSLVILALLASGLFSVFVSSRYLVARTKRRLMATEIARLEIENKRAGIIRADCWYNASCAPVGSWYNCNSSNYGSFTVDCRMDNGPGGADYRKMTVRVRWNEAQI